jgi:hypothetical protein
MSKLAVVGCRDYNDYDDFKKYMLDFTKDKKILEIVYGGAPGTDAMAEKYAIENKIPLKVFPAAWSKYGKSAGKCLQRANSVSCHLSNEQIVNYSDIGIAFLSPISKGTINTINLFAKHKKFCRIVKI